MANPFFNAEYYLEKNPDVAAAVGGDKEIAEQHYFLHGAAEALNGDVADRKPAPWFDIQFYANSRADLADVPADQLFLHFVLHGMREGLSPMEGVEFDADTYLAANEDLVEALGIADPENLTEDEALLLQQHFFAHGYREGREGGPEIPGYDPDPIDLTELTEALEVYQDAVAARAAFLEEVVEEFDSLDDESTEEEIRKAIADAVDEAKTNADDTGLEDVSPNEYSYSSTESAEVIEAMIKDDLATLAKTLADAKAAVNKVDGLMTAVNAYLAAETRVEQAEKALDEADKVAAGELGRVKGLNAGAATWALVDSDDFDFEDGDVIVEDGDGNPIIRVEGGKVVAADPTDAELDGFAELLAAAKAYYEAADLLVTREERLSEAAGRVNDLDADFDADPATDSVAQKYINAVNESEAFDDAVAAYRDATALVAELEARDNAVDAAVEAIEDLGFNLVPFENNEAVGTEEDDVFVYIAETDAIIDLFGEVGDDVLFIGTEFIQGDDIENGNPSALEVFFIQDGDDAVVVIEQTPFGTNVAGDAEVDTITLIGVDASTLQLVDGYVVIA